MIGSWVVVEIACISCLCYKELFLPLHQDQQSQNFPSELSVHQLLPVWPFNLSVTSNASSEILSSPNLKALTFSELKNSTRNFHPDCFLGEGRFGYVFKGWIDECTCSAAKPGSGMAIAVKKLKSERFQGHKKWLVGLFLLFSSFFRGGGLLGGLYSSMQSYYSWRNYWYSLKF